MESGSAKKSAGIVEIRVHGVGQQSGYRALGEPVGTALNGWVVLRKPPRLPDHPLQLVNWWRSNRRRAGSVWWYLAFPFTLVNVAGRMSLGTAETSAADGHRLAAVLHRVAVLVTGLVVTSSQLAWMIVLAETLLRYVPSFVDPSLLGRLVPLLAGGLLGALLIQRWVRVIRQQADESGTSGKVLAAHLAAAIGPAIALAIYRPAQLAYSGWPSVEAPDAAAGEHMHLDAMALWILLSIAVVMLLAGMLSAVYLFGSGRQQAERTSLPMAGLVLAVAVVLMHTVTALLRMALDNLTNYVSGLLYPAAPGALEYQFRTLLAYDDPGVAGDSRLDLFPYQALILLLGVLVAAAFVTVRAPGLTLRGLFSSPRSRDVWWHDFISRVPRMVPVIALIGGALGVAGLSASVSLGEGRLGGPIFGLGVLLLQLAGGVVILSTLLGQFPTIREAMAKVADIAGFWPIRDHPLAGVSYRQPVVEGIVALLIQAREDNLRPVLFGHSQGSMVCAWLLANHPLPDGGAPPVFVSAGSPLESIYAPLFPAYVYPSFQVRVKEATGAWANYWRRTDPLAAPISQAHNVQLADSSSDPLGHTGYWGNAVIASFIDSVKSAGPGISR